MDLKIKDVAELLSVSETTIRRWVKDRKIPVYQLNQQYRFSRNEIEDWMMKCKINLTKNDTFPFKEELASSSEEKLSDNTVAGNRLGSQQFSLYRSMYKGDVIKDATASNKKQLIREIIQKVACQLSLDEDLITELLLDREALMSTAINSGIAVPHPRETVLKTLGSDAIITVFLEKPIDYGALDGLPVHTLFFLFSSSDKTHLHLLSKLAHLCNLQQALNFFVTRPSRASLLAYVKEWEGSLRD
jgi:nitrogen PTS system EIIA component